MKLRRILVCAFGVSLLWSWEIWLWGGFLVRLGHLRISARHFEPPLVVGLLCLAAAFTPFGPDGRRAVEEEWRWWRNRVLRHAVVPVARLVQSAWRAVRPAMRLVAPYVPPAVTLLLIAIVAAGAVSRWMPPRSLWLDEETIAINLRDRSFVDLAGTLWFGQSAPYGWMALERAVLLIGGAREPVLRLLPLACYVATMVVAFAAGRRWLNAVGTFVLVWCCAFSAWTLHYAFEVKPYTADVLGALAITALAAWALDADDVVARGRRLRIWWMAAAVSLWGANGALLAAPGCAIVVVLSIWRRDGWRAVIRASAPGLIWIASFALCYRYSLQFSVASHYLRDYWASTFPAADSGPAARWRWLARQLRPLADNPGSTTTGLLLWLACAAGLLTTPRRRLAALAAAAPLTAFALGWFRIVPLHDRVALWMTPHVYLGAAMLADRAAAWSADAWRRRSWRWVPAAAAAGVASGWLAVNLAGHHGRYLAPPEMDAGTRGDAAAVRWLMASRAPGDTVITTHMGWPAIWWYGGVAPGDGQPATPGHLPDGTPALELQPGLQTTCGDDLAQTIARSRRTLIYVGFPDVPPSFLSDLRQVLEHAGKTIAIASFDPGRVWIVEPRREGTEPAEASPGCMPVWPALRW